MDSSGNILVFLLVLGYSLIGACLGSFSSAIAYRCVRKKSWIIDKDMDSGSTQPARSFCPSCKHQLSALDLIPVLSWLCLGGKCRYCKASISGRYPLIEMLGALLMAIFFFSSAGGESLVIFVITLPFSLAFILMLLQQFKPPFYFYGLFFFNIIVLLDALIWGGKNA